MERVPEAILQSGLLQGGERVFAAFSGGADSTALLLGLAALRERLAITLCAVHVNHGLRGAESDRDEAFCVTVCEKMNIPLTVRRVDANAEAARTRCSVEEAARNLRYAVFSELADGENDRVATAHTASDNTETVLHNLVRGTGLAGLCGIPPRRGRFIRPLLTLTRPDLLAFLAAQGQDFVEDSTNADDAHTRNRLRHHVVPLLLEENPALYRTVGGMTEQLRAEQDYLTTQADAAFDACRCGKHALRGLEAVPLALRRRCIARLLREGGVVCSFAMVETAQRLLAAGGKCTVGPGHFLVAAGDVLMLERVTDADPEITPQPLEIGENRVIDGYCCTVERVSADDFTNGSNIHRKFTNNKIDYDKIVGVAVFRRRVAGDTIALAGRGFTSRVKKLLQEHVPHRQRPFVHYLADADGLIWVQDIGIAARVAPDAHTKICLKLTVTRLKDKE